MRWSQAHIPTLRDDPAEAEAVSHRLLVRAGFIRQLMAGAYSILPAAYRVRAKIRKIIEEEMDAIGGQQFLLPAIHPAELWQKSGRWDIMGDEMFRLVDRKGADLALGMTHEEVFATLASELTSYKQLPQVWYQIQTKFRDEPRPKSGVLHVREFTMKDAYTFDIDDGSLDSAFNDQFEAYQRIFTRMGLDAVPVEASSGAMGGSDSVEFMVRSEAGEDDVAHSANCGYAANVERAGSRVAEPTTSGAVLDAPQEFATPGVRTIEALVNFDGGAPADRQIKTLVYMLDGSPALVLLRGDHTLQLQKLQDTTGAIDIRPANPEEVRDLLGADPGSLGAVGLADLTIICDPALEGANGMTTGANRDDFHLRGVDVGRDISVTQWADVHAVAAGEPCLECGEPLEVFRAIEVGHIFKLGTKYSEAMGATVLDENGKSRVIIMGSYGIGLERNLAAIVETHHDDNGIVWPVAVAPWEVVVTLVKPKDEESKAAGELLHTTLIAEGIDVILDDRNERPGVKFNDAELVGIPIRVTIGPRGMADGVAEVVERGTGASEDVAIGDVAAIVIAKVRQAR